MVIIATFYRFVELDNYEDMQPVIKQFCIDQQIKGTILLAEEGINATIAGKSEAIQSFFAFMNRDMRLMDLKWQSSEASYQPFQRMKVRLKREIVGLGVDELNIKSRGELIEPEDWGELIAQKDVVLIDTRNTYETKLGKFENAIDPNTDNFRDFPKQHDLLEKIRDKKIAMYCTGGVRCEKSTAYMKLLGVEKVYHLKGGILNYLKVTKNANKKWVGDCFVFDDRVAINDKLLPSENIKCVICGNKASTDDLKSVPRGQVKCLRCAKIATSSAS